jgi:hypothetical protein
MRGWIANIIIGLGVVAALVAAGFWMHFIWSFEWGRFGSRSWGLWFFFAFVMGSGLIVFSGIFIFMWISSLIER